MIHICCAILLLCATPALYGTRPPQSEAQQVTCGICSRPIEGANGSPGKRAYHPACLLRLRSTQSQKNTKPKAPLL